MFIQKRFLVSIGLLMVFSLSECDFGELKILLNSKQWRHLENDLNNYNRQNLVARGGINKLRWPNFLIDPMEIETKASKRNIATGRGDGFRPG
ncbi:unnamed protein product [Meloidogyne enterolobii]|uniref:Uncharacterized protein n=2 Tax=Meloidogyne enterolobii TaxID=390850 RepID=A0A6V7TTA2_MELEN|nr:unnamed protein product [Meloidogyne enterolobii]CAD2176558.1 unnamed protein product [Meloidogyne enterolobii]